MHEENVHFHGNDLADGILSGLADACACQGQCQAHGDCLYWSFAEDGTGRCWLKSSNAGGRESQSERTSGSRSCGSNKSFKNLTNNESFDQIIRWKTFIIRYASL